MQNGLYLIVGLVELCIVVLFSNYLLDRNVYLGQLIHFILFLLFNVQMLILHFAGAFITSAMLSNISFLHDLHGKFGEYLTLLIPMTFCILIPVNRIEIRKRTIPLLITCLVLELAVLSNQGSQYSPLWNIYHLYRVQHDYRKITTLSQKVSAGEKEFYQADIEDFIDKPEELAETPNIVLIFVEGLSENVILDERNIMPNLKKLKLSSLSFKDYYNHTFATLKGLIGQLYSGYQLANLDKNFLISMQSILKDRGYHTTFINTEPTNKDFTDYLVNLQFDDLVTNMDIVDYNAAYIHDKDAFNLLYLTIEKQKANPSPFFTAIYTFGTHVSLNSPDEQYADGTNKLLNKFYNLDYYLGRFIEKFKESSLYDNTILVITTDHATYADEDFLTSFPNYDRIHPELDIIPLIIYHKGVRSEIIDANGRNSLDLVPTILDYLDISEENFFLGRSLFASQSEEIIPDFIFYDSYYTLSTKGSQIEVLEEAQYLNFVNLLTKYFNVKNNLDNNVKLIEDYVTTVVSEDCSTMDITFKNVSGKQYKNIWFPIWSDIDNQDDLVWYQAIQNNVGDWYTTVDLSKHNSKGSYTIHVYEGEKEPENYLGATTAYVSDDPPSHSSANHS